MGGGAWPFLVGGVICLVNSDNERDLSLLISHVNLSNQVDGGPLSRNSKHGRVGASRRGGEGKRGRGRTFRSRLDISGVGGGRLNITGRSRGRSTTS